MSTTYLSSDEATYAFDDVDLLVAIGLLHSLVDDDLRRGLPGFEHALDEALRSYGPGLVQLDARSLAGLPGAGARLRPMVVRGLSQLDAWQGAIPVDFLRTHVSVDGLRFERPYPGQRVRDTLLRLGELLVGERMG